MKGFATGILVLLAHAVLGQGPDFTAPTTACLQENLVLINTSVGTVSHEWDFCEGDLGVQPFFAPVGTIGLANSALEIRSVEENGHFYSFVCSAGTDRIVRMDFSSDPRNLTPLSSEIDPGVTTPTGIDVFKKGTDWYGIVGTFADPANIRLLKFGNSLANTPSVTTVTLPGPAQVRLGRAIRSVNEGNNTIIFVANAANGIVTRLVLGPAMDGSVLSADEIVVTGAVSLFSLDILSTGGNKFIVATDFNNGNIYKVSLGNSFANAPVSVAGQTLSQSVVNPSGIQLAAENGSIIGLLSTQSGQFFRLTWSSDMTSDNPVQVELTGINTNYGVRGLSLIRASGHYYVYFTNYLYSTIGRLDFEKTCNEVNTPLSTEESPSGVQYATPGTYTITLRSRTTSGSNEFLSKSVTVSGLIAPQLTIVNNGICAGSTVVLSTPGFTNGTWSWDFGNGNSSTDSNPATSYATPGTYMVSLSIVAANGCGNYKATPLKIYRDPVASFMSPTGLICTNNEFTFTNTTNDVFDGNLGYDWQVNNVSVASTRDLKFAFSAQGNNDVRLIASIPGCSNDVVQIINNVQPGPAPSFTSSGICNGRTVSFTNSSSGSITSYAWTFGDGRTSTQVNPQHVFDLVGTYNVTLDVTASNGCVSTVVHPLSIYTTPIPSFSLDLPPFSCSGSPSQFHDTTPSMTDSNIQAWNWTFGDTGSGTGKNPVHTYTNAGQYPVRLSVTTDRGCTNFVDQQVIISPSPTALFNYDLACVNKSVHFLDVSTGGVSSWQWKVGNALYNTSNPTHIFNAAGNYNVQLVVTGNNNCTASITRQVTVPVVPNVDFMVTNPCSDQTAVFSDITPIQADPIIQRNWLFNGIGTATGQQASYVFNGASDRNVELTVKSLSGCTYAARKVIAIRQSPTASFTMSDQSGPPPLRVVFTNTSTAASLYLWSFGDGSSTLTAVSPDHTFASLGDYNVSMLATSSNGCSMTSTKTIKVITPINELAIEDFLLRQITANSYQGYVKIRNNGNYRITSFVVNYETGGGIVLSETVPSDISVGEVKTYTLGTSFNQPSQSAFVCAELNDDTNLNNNKACATLSGDAIIFNVSPNPADAFIDVESVHAAAEELRVRIYNMSGGIAYERTFDVSKGLSRLSLDTQNLSPGIYVAVISSGSATTTQKLLILR